MQHFTVTLTGSAQVLGAGVTITGKAKSLIIQTDAANANLVFVGAVGTTLSSSDFGYRIEIPAATIPSQPLILPGADPMKVQVLGTNTQKVHVLVIYQ